MKPVSGLQRWQASCWGGVKLAANLFPIGRGKGRSEAGQALIEFALVLLLVILPFTFVLIDAAFMLFTLANVSNTAREGARAGAIYQTTTAPSPSQTFADQVAAIDAARLAYMQQTTRQTLGPLVSFDQCALSVTYYPASPAIGNPYRALDDVRFTLACPRRLLFGLVDAGSVTLTSQATMRIEPGGVAPLP